MSFPLVLGADALAGGSDAEEEAEESPAAPTGSWNAYGSILAAARADAAAAALMPPVACPHCGEPLKTGPRGELYCPADGWRPY